MKGRTGKKRGVLYIQGWQYVQGDWGPMQCTLAEKKRL